MTTLYRVQRSLTLDSLDRLIAVDPNRGEIAWCVPVSQDDKRVRGSPYYGPPTVMAGRIVYHVARLDQRACWTMHTTGRCWPSSSFPPGHTQVHSDTSSARTKSITACSPLVGIPQPARTSGTALPQRGRDFSHRGRSRLNISYFWNECGEEFWRKLDGPRSSGETSKQSRESSPLIQLALWGNDWNWKDKKGWIRLSIGDSYYRGMHFTPGYPISCGRLIRLPRTCWTISE